MYGKIFRPSSTQRVLTVQRSSPLLAAGGVSDVGRKRSPPPTGRRLAVLWLAPRFQESLRVLIIFRVQMVTAKTRLQNSVQALLRRGTRDGGGGRGKMRESGRSGALWHCTAEKNCLYATRVARSMPLHSLLGKRGTVQISCHEERIDGCDHAFEENRESPSLGHTRRRGTYPYTRSASCVSTHQ